ncbi:HD domain-containing protein [Patescibacteria group bacterium]|nr:HD domain-containing protein [Patescibacteria group bacterium]
MNIFSHILNRGLAHVMRFSSTPQHFPESVAEHSFYTAYYVSLLCDLLAKVDIQINREKAITMALIHDTEEMFSGDILNPFKHYSNEVKEAIQRVNEEVIPQMYEGLPDDMKEKYIGLWNEESQGESTEAQLVKIADRLSLLSKCAEEVKVGNGFFKKIYESQLQFLLDFDTVWWKKIKDQVLPESSP